MSVITEVSKGWTYLLMHFLWLKLNKNRYTDLERYAFSLHTTIDFNASNVTRKIEFYIVIFKKKYLNIMVLGTAEKKKLFASMTSCIL